VNSCPNCKILIRSERYNYCPYCNQIIKNVRLDVPDLIYTETPFKISITSIGIESVEIQSIELNDKIIECSPINLSPNECITYEQCINKIGRYQLRITLPDRVIEQGIIVNKLGSVSISWQNIQVLSLDHSENDNKIYVSKELEDKTINICKETSVWIRINKISILTPNYEWNCFKKADGYEIPDDFFKFLEKEETCKGSIKILSEDGYSLTIDKITFEYVNDLPDITLNSDDYTNEKPITVTDRNISYTLYYKIEGKIQRPVDKINLLYRSDFISNKDKVIYFDDDQKIYEMANIQVEKARGFNNESVKNILKNLEFTIEYEIKGKNTKFQRYFYIPFRIISKQDLIVDENKIVSIDFGTSNTCIVMQTNDNQNEDIMDIQIIPTTLKFEKFNSFPPHSIQYGYAINNDDKPLTFATNFKPRLPRDEELFYFDKCKPANIQAIKPSTLTKWYLEHLLNNEINKLGYKPGKAIISYPATFSEETRNKLIGIIQDIGYIVNASTILTEPENIALYFALEDNSIKEKIEKDGSVTICVFDCGGGTTDVSVIRVTQDTQLNIEILAKWGTNEFSGNYLTYLIGKEIDGGKEWFPKEFSKLYTAKNEELEEYFKRIQYYEDQKFNINNMQLIDKDKLIEDIKYIMRIIYGYVKKIIQVLFKYHKISFVYTDYLILAGNSCKLPLFNEVAKEEFPDSKIIWEPEKGKKAVAFGALRTYELISSLNINGMLCNEYEYSYMYGLNSITLFEPMIDMQEGAKAVSEPLKPKGDIPIKARKIIGDTNKEPVIKFFIPVPKNIDPNCFYKFKLRFINKIISYSWITEYEDSSEETEFIEIYRET